MINLYLRYFSELRGSQHLVVVESTKELFCEILPRIFERELRENCKSCRQLSQKMSEICKQIASSKNVA